MKALGQTGEGSYYTVPFWRASFVCALRETKDVAVIQAAELLMTHVLSKSII